MEWVCSEAWDGIHTKGAWHTESRVSRRSCGTIQQKCEAGRRRPQVRSNKTAGRVGLVDGVVSNGSGHEAPTSKGQTKLQGGWVTRTALLAHSVGLVAGRGLCGRCRNAGMGVWQDGHLHHSASSVEERARRSWRTGRSGGSDAAPRAGTQLVGSERGQSRCSQAAVNIRVDQLSTAAALLPVAHG